MCRVEVIACE